MVTMRNVSFLDLGRLHRSLAAELDLAWHRTLEQSAFVGAVTCESFEAAFAEAHRAPAAASCGSGTDALALALRCLGVGPGDEVLVPAATFVASAEAVIHVGAQPVLIDVDADTLLIDAAAVEDALGPNSRAVMPVHLYGNVVDAEQIRRWRHLGLQVIEDAAQAHLGRSEGLPVGTYGDAACFSFFPGKNLGALGDGGAVISSDRSLITRIKTLRDHGRSHKYRHDDVGWCSRLDGVQAAFLEVKLMHLASWTDARRAIAARYAAELAEREIPNVHQVPWRDGSVHHLFVVRVPASQRDSVRASMAATGVQTGVHYPLALSQQPSMALWHRPCPEAERASTEVLSLPMDPLMPLDDVEFVCAALQSAVYGAGSSKGTG